MSRLCLLLAIRSRPGPVPGAICYLDTVTGVVQDAEFNILLHMCACNYSVHIYERIWTQRLDLSWQRFIHFGMIRMRDREGIVCKKNKHVRLKSLWSYIDDISICIESVLWLAARRLTGLVHADCC